MPGVERLSLDLLLPVAHECAALGIPVMALFPAGSHIIAGHDIYGGTYRLFASILSARGLTFSFVDMSDARNVRAAIRPDTRAIWIETPSNPLLGLVDIDPFAGAQVIERFA